MKKFLNIVLTFVLVLCAFSPFCFRDQGHNHGKRVKAEGETVKYYTVYDSLFLANTTSPRVLRSIL